MAHDCHASAARTGLGCAARPARNPRGGLRADLERMGAQPRERACGPRGETGGGARRNDGTAVLCHKLTMGSARVCSRSLVRQDEVAQLIHLGARHHRQLLALLVEVERWRHADAQRLANVLELLVAVALDELDVLVLLDRGEMRPAGSAITRRKRNNTTRSVRCAAQRRLLRARAWLISTSLGIISLHGPHLRAGARQASPRSAAQANRVRRLVWALLSACGSAPAAHQSV